MAGQNCTALHSAVNVIVLTAVVVLVLPALAVLVVVAHPPLRDTLAALPALELVGSAPLPRPACTGLVSKPIRRKPCVMLGLTNKSCSTRQCVL